MSTRGLRSRFATHRITLHPDRQGARSSRFFPGGRVLRAIDAIHAFSVADETGDTIGAGQRAPSLNRLESVGGVADVDAAVSQQPTDLARADATSNDDPVGLFTIARDATDATARQEAVDLEGSHCGTVAVPFAGWTSKAEAAIRQGQTIVSTRA